MRCVTISDTHCRHGEIDVPPGDVLIHCGDSLGRGSIGEFTRFVSWLKGQPHRHKVIVAGNHDRVLEDQPFAETLLSRPRWHYLKDSGVEIEGVRFWGSPWTPPFFRWAFMKDEDDLAEEYAKIPGDTDVLITHGPPRGILDKTSNDSCVGSTALRAAVRRVQPQFHCFGHIHEGHGCWLGDREAGSLVRTSYINASICTANYEPTNLAVTFDVEPWTGSKRDG